jgi:hypothetical protein
MINNVIHRALNKNSPLDFNKWAIGSRPWIANDTKIAKILMKQKK